ncbi:hypothetical protein [Gluconobacter oxydans]|uniref:hypothetical protein n=1 Tax=Gluconobacter oxydans TaxID=442 RepID=UPI0007813DFC|nr:hypothetical protein [Gluconobacter oxydans]
MKKILLSLICCGAFGVAHADPALMKGFVPGGNGVLDAKSRTPSGQPLFDGSGRPTGNMSPVALYSGFVSAATVTSPGAYAPADLPLALTVAGNALGQTAQLVPTGYTVTSASVVAAGNACPASSVFTLAGTGTKIIVSDGNGLSGSVVTVSVGGTAASASDVPANPVTLTSSVAGCTPPQFTLGWGLAGASVQLPGWGYTATPSVTAPASSLAGGVASSILAQVQTGPVNLASQMLPSSALGTQAVSFAQGNASAASAQAAYGGSVPRTLSQKWGDRYNLADLGAKLDGSASDKALIQSIYNTLPNFSLVEVPKNSKWDGTIQTPDPNKSVTWLYDGSIGGDYPSPGGDGDVSITLNSGLYAGEVTKNSRSVKDPINALFWNMNPGFCGNYCRNYAQMPAINAYAISGPTSSGNTSAISAELDSYGQGPSSNYDVALNVFAKKTGQNSVWGIVDDIQDFSGKSPGFAGSWNEFDLWANGDDIPTFDPQYGTAYAGHRSMLYMSMGSLDGGINYWQPNQGVAGWTSGQYDRPAITRIMVGVNGTLWLWYPQKSGTTGSIAPNFPAPTEAVASYDGATTLTVSSIVSGTISAGDYVTGSQPVYPFQIVKQLTGPAGGSGTYQIALDSGDGGEPSFGSEAVYIAPRLTDGSTVWQFGERFNTTIGSVMWLTGGGGDAVDTVVGGEGLAINGAWIDSSNNSLGPTASVIRVAAGQTAVDFTGNNTLAGRNQHTLAYQNYGMAYKVGGAAVFSVMDDGSQRTAYSTPSASGSTIDDATVVDGPFIVVSVKADAQGVKVGNEMGNEGTSHTIVNNSSHTLSVYPINGQWLFIGKSAAAPVVLPAYASVKLTTVSSYNHAIYAEYHPPAP